MDATPIPEDLELARDRANPHYLQHMAHTAERREVQASEDIISGSGIKLLAKGARIGPRTREQLLLHKLAKPLEDCVRIDDGVLPQSLEPIAAALLERHALLASICRHERAEPVGAALAGLPLSVPVQSLLTLYADFQGDRLQHGVGVAMLSLALARRLLPGESEQHRLLAIAGLLHDVGELYIDPQHLRAQQPMRPEIWRHIASHPVIGYRVLREMQGAGRVVAEAVLNHHERLDGFGYPRGIADAQFTLDGQILATSEWLMGLIESGQAPLARASVVSKLMPGEFGMPLQTVLAQADVEQFSDLPDTPQALDEALAELEQVMETLARFRELRAGGAARLEGAGPALRRIFEQAVARMQRIQAAFSSSGLDFAASPRRIVAELKALRDPQAHLELQVLAREFGWRLRELEREALLRAGLLGDADLALMTEVMQSLGLPPAAE
ncbi:MAG TPA: HD domain-containing phosphohydrolase [Roseateles sp.]|nr:HD domain-containing phosphohydrolase [Roseateles sp.]